MPQGSGIATVSLVDNGRQDLPKQTKEAGGATAGECLKEAIGSMAAVLRQMGPNQSKVMWGLDNGTYVGDEHLLMPQKMVDQIHKGEYVEMADLLLKFWVAPMQGGEEAATQRLARSRGRRRT